VSGPAGFAALTLNGFLYDFRDVLDGYVIGNTNG
jgi:hypothetical protein